MHTEVIALNETIRNILSRRSIRAYAAQPVQQDDLELIVQCGRFAPTAMGRQPWHFSVVRSRAALDEVTRESKRLLQASGDEKMRKMAEDPSFDTFRGAPCAVIVSGDAGNRFSDIDCACAVENMALAAQSLGLGSCVIASFRMAFEQDAEGKLARRFGIPDGYKPTLALALGYAAEPPAERAPRLPDTINFVD